MSVIISVSCDPHIIFENKHYIFVVETVRKYDFSFGYCYVQDHYNTNITPELWDTLN